MLKLRNSSFKTIYSFRIESEIYLTYNCMSSRQFLPCGKGKENSNQVLPNICKTLTHSLISGVVSYICRQDGVQDREFDANCSLGPA